MEGDSLTFLCLIQKGLVILKTPAGELEEEHTHLTV
jgi:hypothetical protein